MFPPESFSFSVFVSVSHAWKGSSIQPAPPQSSECMSHMPHSHDIVGPGAARGSSHSQDLLLCIAHTALEPARQEIKKGVNSPLSIWLGFLIVPQKEEKKKKRLGIYFAPLTLPKTDLSGEKLLIRTCMSFPLVRCCLLENNNVDRGLFFEQSNRPLEGQSDQIDLLL